MCENTAAKKLRIAIGSDHAGYNLKEEVLGSLRDEGFEITDLGTFSVESVDYPDIAVLVSSKVVSKDFDIGILVCGTGVGMSITANKIAGIRAAVTSDTYSAQMARAHNDANVLCMGARVVGPGLALEIAKAFIETDFEDGLRHGRRVSKINALDK